LTPISPIQGFRMPAACGTAPRVRRPASESLQGRCYGADGGGEEGEDMAFIGADVNRWSTPMQKLNDLGIFALVLRAFQSLRIIVILLSRFWPPVSAVENSVPGSLNSERQKGTWHREARLFRGAGGLRPPLLPMKTVAHASYRHVSRSRNGSRSSAFQSTPLSGARGP
jgi:hypothetical protein